MGQVVVTEFISLDEVIEDPAAPKSSSTAGGRSRLTVARTATSSTTRS